MACFLVVLSLFWSFTFALNNSQYVNLFIGTEGPDPGNAWNGGNVFPGASFPFGAVKVGIDTTEFNASTDANAGYTPDGNVTAITMLHVSGTGGAPKYGIIPQMPLTSLVGVNLLDNMTYMQPRVGKDSAKIGYYTTKLANGVQVDFTSSMHAGLIKYSFLKQGERHILVDLSHYLPTQDDHMSSQSYVNGLIELSADKSMYSGSGTWRGGWNQGPDYTVYFCATFDTAPQAAQLFSGPYTDPYWPGSVPAKPNFIKAASIKGGAPSRQSADRIGALFTFPPTSQVIKSKVGVSWISANKSCEFLQEIPSWDLDITAAQATQAWNTEVLDSIEIADIRNSSLLTMFYSALYRTALLPSNRTGENPFWDDHQGYYDDIYTIWDTFRCWFSLELLIKPKLATEFVNSLISVWRHERFMPDGRSGNYNGRVQGGSNADNVLADAYVKGLGRDGSINWTAGYQAVLTDAEVLPYNNFDPTDLTGGTKEGRGALLDWLKYGYITPNYARSVSRTIEYSLNDFAVAQIAKGESPSDVPKYLNRSAGWQRIWNRKIKSFNFTGFLAPTYPDGRVQGNQPDGSYSPETCGGCEWDSIAYEALPWEYSWTVPFDMQTLIEFCGGPNLTEARLDIMFVPGLKTSGVGPGGINAAGTSLFNPGNEPSFATPFLYNYLPGRQWKSVMRSREIVDIYYGPDASGVPGNSDAGALDSWLMWNMIGLYPVVTQPVYLILAPWFSDLKMTAGEGKTLHITAKHLDVAKGNVYVQSVKVNGKDWNKSWLTHDDITVGNATLEFVMGSQRTQWDTGEVPPSPGHIVLKL